MKRRLGDPAQMFEGRSVGMTRRLAERLGGLERCDGIAKHGNKIGGARASFSVLDRGFL